MHQNMSACQNREMATVKSEKMSKKINDNQFVFVEADIIGNFHTAATCDFR